MNVPKARPHYNLTVNVTKRLFIIHCLPQEITDNTGFIFSYIVYLN